MKRIIAALFATVSTVMIIGLANAPAQAEGSSTSTTVVYDPPCAFDGSGCQSTTTSSTSTTVPPSTTTSVVRNTSDNDYCGPDHQCGTCPYPPQPDRQCPELTTTTAAKPRLTGTVHAVTQTTVSTARVLTEQVVTVPTTVAILGDPPREQVVAQPIASHPHQPNWNWVVLETAGCATVAAAAVGVALKLRQRRSQ